MVCSGVFGGFSAHRCTIKIHPVFVVPGPSAGPTQVLLFPLDGLDM